MNIYGDYEYIKSLVESAICDGLDELAAVYAAMASELKSQIEILERIDRMAMKAARQLEQDIKDTQYWLETSGLRSRAERHDYGMQVSTLNLAIRNAVYFS